MNASVASAARPALASTPARATAERIVVHFVPRWPKNPYHAELARHLGDFNVAVDEESRLKKILGAARSHRSRPHIVHLHALPPFSFSPAKFVRLVLFWWRLFRLRQAGVKIVWTIHNVADHESAHPLIDRWLLRACYHFVHEMIVHSPGAWALVESQWKVNRRPNISIVHHGHFIDCYPPAMPRGDARRRLGLADDALVFLFLGNIRPYKGVTRLVTEFNALARPGLQLVIAGEVLSPALRSEIEREIGASAAIRFRPEFLADTEIPGFMAAADVVVFPYTKALTSGALILAMSFGRACVAPAIGALADTLEPHGGFLYDPADPGALRRALLAAIARRAELPAMGAYNFERVSRWGWADAAAKTNNVYRSCLGHAS